MASIVYHDGRIYRQLVLRSIELRHSAEAVPPEKINSIAITPKIPSP